MIDVKINNEKELIHALSQLAQHVKYNVPLMRTIAGTMQS
ncbi:virion morphogenesis protein, partial [Haemophilus influenzae]